MAKSKRPKDKMSQIIGEMGRWQIQNISIVFFIGIPGLAHIYSSAFVAAKTDFWCSEDLAADSNLTYLEAGVSINNEACQKGCKDGFSFDHSFWHSTLR